MATPPAAKTVIEGEVTEETLRLCKELDEERAARKRVEQEHASMADEFHRYKDATEARALPVPVTQGKVASEPTRRRMGFLNRR